MVTTNYTYDVFLKIVILTWEVQAGPWKAPKATAVGAIVANDG